MAKVVRVLIYEGDPVAIKKTLSRGAINANGQHSTHNLAILSIITTAEFTICSLCERETEDLSLICKYCANDAKKEALSATLKVREEKNARKT